MESIVRLFKDEDATTSVEYAIMVAAILLTVVVAIAAVGQNTALMYSDIDSEMRAHGF
jgi:Flp pilus assembly pilin Flp